MQYTLTVHCGEKTCFTDDTDDEGPVFCRFVRTPNCGPRRYCALFGTEQELQERDGWLMRSDECLKTLQKVAS